MKIWLGYFNKLLNCEQPSEIPPPPSEYQKWSAMPKPVFRGSKVSDTRFKGSQITCRERDSGRIVKERRIRTNPKNMEKNHLSIGKQNKYLKTGKRRCYTTDHGPIHKKRDRNDYNNYQGIALLNVAYTIFTSCILSSIKETAESVIY